MHLFFDPRDLATHKARGSLIPDWLDDLGAKSLSKATPNNNGFLFAGARSIEDYRRLTSKFAALRDSPAEREPLLRLDYTLDAMAHLTIPSPRTWRLPLDAPIPSDITFPLFVRTATTSLKLGGTISRVRNASQLESEAAELRRILGWDALILAREWLSLAEAGSSVYGPVPQEIRVWIVDQIPHAWSFHYMNVVKKPSGFPPSSGDLQTLFQYALQVGTAFRSRCIVADFAKTKRRQWTFIEAGPGSAAGTAHEHVFKSVAAKLIGQTLIVPQNDLGGLF